jgi:hypothetical protein
MNKFTVEPESLASLFGCAFWLAFLAAGTALFFAAMLSLGR